MRNRADRSRASGFTLLEILCVIALVGMAGMMVMLAIPHNTYRLRDEYQKIQTVVTQTTQQAQLTGEVYGFRVLPAGWEIVVLRRNPAKIASQPAAKSVVDGYHWQAASRGRHVIRHQLPTGFQLTLLTATQRFDSAAPADPDAAPPVLFLPGGEVTPFRFYLGENDNNQTPQVIHINDRGVVAEPESLAADTVR